MITMNDLFDSVDHIKFKSLDAALRFRNSYGGHLFVSKGAKCVVWFSSGWTATPILTSPVLMGVEGVLNPTQCQIDSLRGLANPHKEGSVAHNHFAFFYDRAMSQTSDALRERFSTLKLEAQNFLSLSPSQMSEAEFEADVIARVYQYRFDQHIDECAEGKQSIAMIRGAKNPFTLEQTLEKLRYYLTATKRVDSLVLLEQAVAKASSDKGYAVQMEEALLRGSTVECRELFSAFGEYFEKPRGSFPFYPHHDAVNGIDSAMLHIKIGDEQQAIDDYNILTG